MSSLTFYLFKSRISRIRFFIESICIIVLIALLIGFSRSFPLISGGKQEIILSNFIYSIGHLILTIHYVLLFTGRYKDKRWDGSEYIGNNINLIMFYSFILIYLFLYNYIEVYLSFDLDLSKFSYGDNQLNDPMIINDSFTEGFYLKSFARYFEFMGKKLIWVILFFIIPMSLFNKIKNNY